MGMKINCSKTKLMPVGKLSEDTLPICLNNEEIQEVCNFEYLGSILESTCSVDREVDSRQQKVGTVYQMWRHKAFRSRKLSIATKVQVFQSMVHDVGLSLWWGDMIYESTECKEAEDIPDEVFRGYFRVHSAGQEEE